MGASSCATAAAFSSHSAATTAGLRPLESASQPKMAEPLIQPQKNAESIALRIHARSPVSPNSQLTLGQPPSGGVSSLSYGALRK